MSDVDKLDGILACEDYPLDASLEEVIETTIELVKRLKKAEAALDRLFPGWQMEGACLPDCKGACCEI